MNLYYTDENGKVVGPVPRQQLQKLVDSGQTAVDCQACFEGSEHWNPLSFFVRPTPKPKAVTVCQPKASPLPAASWPKFFASLTPRARLVLASVVVAVACLLLYGWTRNSTLTRKNALAMLQQREFSPVTEFLRSISSDTFPPSESKARGENWDWEEANFVKFFVAATKDGLIEMKQSTAGSYKRWEAHSTGKGREFVLTTEGTLDQILALKMATRKAAQVTSIGAPSQLGGKTVSVVNFTYLYTPTPFGAAFDRGTGYHKYSGEAPDTALFALYDDGWHLENVGGR